MLGRFDEALEATSDSADGATHVRVEARRGTFAAWCEQLAASQLTASLDHNDLHPWNVLGDGADGARFYDWGDSVVAHPFAAMLVPLGFVQRTLDVALDDGRFTDARDAYMAGFADLAPGEDLVATLEVACRVAKVARVLTWARAIEAARQDGEDLDDQWTRAPIETLASLLDDSYLGGA